MPAIIAAAVPYILQALFVSFLGLLVAMVFSILPADPFLDVFTSIALGPVNEFLGWFNYFFDVSFVVKCYGLLIVAWGVFKGLTVLLGIAKLRR